jgi:GAF domain-containing protein
VVVAEEPLVVSDARDHPLLRDNPAIRELGAIAYAGVPLVTAAGRTIGTVCVMDAKPRLWTREDVALLRDLADTAVTTIELRAAVRRARDEVAG